MEKKQLFRKNIKNSVESIWLYRETPWSYLRSHLQRATIKETMRCDEILRPISSSSFLLLAHSHIAKWKLLLWSAAVAFLMQLRFAHLLLFLFFHCSYSESFLAYCITLSALHIIYMIFNCYRTLRGAAKERERDDDWIISDKKSCEDFREQKRESRDAVTQCKQFTCLMTTLTE